MSIAGFREDLEAMKRRPGTRSLRAVPQGTGQIFLREIVLLAVQNAYTLGQLVLVRRLLGVWNRS